MKDLELLLISKNYDAIKLKTAFYIALADKPLEVLTYYRKFSADFIEAAKSSGDSIEIMAFSNAFLKAVEKDASVLFKNYPINEVIDFLPKDPMKDLLSLPTMKDYLTRKFFVYNKPGEVPQFAQPQKELLLKEAKKDGEEGLLINLIRKNFNGLAIEVLEADKSLLNKTFNSENPMSAAIQNQNIEMVKHLVSKGFDISLNKEQIAKALVIPGTHQFSSTTAKQIYTYLKTEYPGLKVDPQVADIHFLDSLNKFCKDDKQKQVIKLIWEHQPINNNERLSFETNENIVNSIKNIYKIEELSSIQSNIIKNHIHEIQIGISVMLNTVEKPVLWYKDPINALIEIVHKIAETLGIADKKLTFAEKVLDKRSQSLSNDMTQMTH